MDEFEIKTGEYWTVLRISIYLFIYLFYILYFFIYIYIIFFFSYSVWKRRFAADFDRFGRTICRIEFTE